MKKFLLGLFLAMFCIPSVLAAPRPGRPGFVRAGHHHLIRKPSHHVHYHSAASFWGGVAGSVIGSYLAVNQYQPQVYSSRHCYVSVSRFTGRVIKKCADTEVSDILYID